MPKPPETLFGMSPFAETLRIVHRPTPDGRGDSCAICLSVEELKLFCGLYLRENILSITSQHIPITNTHLNFSLLVFLEPDGLRGGAAIADGSP